MLSKKLSFVFTANCESVGFSSINRKNINALKKQFRLAANRLNGNYENGFTIKYI